MTQRYAWRRRLASIAVLIIGSVTLGCASLVNSFSGRKEACEIINIGIPASAIIERLIDTGTTINDNPVLEFVIQVLPADGPIFQAHAKALVSRLDIASFQPGRVVPVRYDPLDKSRVALELWDCSTR